MAPPARCLYWKIMFSLQIMFMLLIRLLWASSYSDEFHLVHFSLCNEKHTNTMQMSHFALISSVDIERFVSATHTSFVSSFVRSHSRSFNRYFGLTKCAYVWHTVIETIHGVISITTIKIRCRTVHFHSNKCLDWNELFLGSIFVYY